MTSAGRPLPVTDDADTGGYWRAAADGKLVVRVCGSCGAVLHMPRRYCWRCGTWSEVWQEASGRARLYSWTTVEHQVHPAFPVPYTVVLVELEDHPGVRLIGNLPGAPDLTAGQEFEVTFEAAEGGVTVPQWRPVASATR